MNAELVVRLAYLAASVLFVIALRGLAAPQTARRGVVYAELGMALAVAGTLLRREIVSYGFLLAGAFAGAAAGTLISLRIPMTRMPERIAFSHAFGGLAVALVGLAEHSHRVRDGPPMNGVELAAAGLEVTLGAVTFSGSLVAFGKLGELLPEGPPRTSIQALRLHPASSRACSTFEDAALVDEILRAYCSCCATFDGAAREAA